MRTRKAQSLTPDFTLSFVIFLMIIALSIRLWEVAEDKDAWIATIEDMQKKARLTADILIINPGAPAGWNEDNVVFMGFAEEDHVLNKTKLYYFNKLPYEDAKRIMNLGSNEFNLVFTDKKDELIVMGPTVEGRIAYFASQAPEDVAFLGALNNYTGTWDFYFGGGAAPENSARYVYNSSDNVNIFKTLIANISGYDTIIYEDGHVADSDLTVSEQQDLSDFVTGGGTYFHVQHKWELLRVFGFLDSDFGTEKDVGELVTEDPLFPDLEIGQQKTFEQDSKTLIISSAPAAMSVTPIMVDPSDSDLCLVCMFELGSGKIYYMPDVNDNTSNPVGGFSPTGLSLDFGKDYASANYVVHSDRLALINDSGRLISAKIDLVLWRERI